MAFVLVIDVAGGFGDGDSGMTTASWTHSRSTVASCRILAFGEGVLTARSKQSIFTVTQLMSLKIFLTIQQDFVRLFTMFIL